MIYFLYFLYKYSFRKSCLFRIRTANTLCLKTKPKYKILALIFNICLDYGHVKGSYLTQHRLFKGQKIIINATRKTMFATVTLLTVIYVKLQICTLYIWVAIFLLYISRPIKTN